MIYVKLLWFSVFFLKEGIRSYFGTPTWQTIGVFLAGVLTTVLVVRKMWECLWKPSVRTEKKGTPTREQNDAKVYCAG